MPAGREAETLSAGARSTAPVFVVGSPRSGTTWLYHLLLSSGSFAVYRSETHVYNVLAPRFGDLRRERNRAALLDAWLLSDRLTLSELDPAVVRRAVEERCFTPGAFLRTVMSMMCDRQGARRWADTTPAHLLYMQRIKAEIPDALFVHVVRDGRDVALSMARQEWVRPLPGGRAAGLLGAAAYWEWVVRRGRASGRLLGDAYHEVRYESLVADTRGELERLGAFIGEDLSWEVIQRQAIGSVSRPNTSFPEAAQNPVGRWREGLSDGDAERLESSIGSLLEELGYERASIRAASPAARLAKAFYQARFALRTFARDTTPLGRWMVDMGYFEPGAGNVTPEKLPSHALAARKEGAG